MVNQGLEGQRHLRVPRERLQRRKLWGGFRFCAEEVSQGCGTGGT